MRFMYLAHLGDKYTGEVGTSGHRAPASFQAILNLLATAKSDLQAALAAPAAPAAARNAVAPRGGGVAALKKFHEDQAKQAKPTNEANIQSLRAEIAKYRRWITAQGLHLDRDDNIQWATDNAKVVYDAQIRQHLTQLHLSGGRMFTDAAFTQPFDTEKSVTHFSGPGYAIYVMSEKGNIHVDSHKIGNRHHSSLLAGGNVAGAGEMRVVNGYLNYLSNKSGHYQPNPDHLLQVIHVLDKKGIRDYRVTLSGPRTQTFDSVDALMRHLQLEDMPDYELGKLIAYQKKFESLAPLMLQEKGWAWRTDPTLQKPGFYTAAGVMVPHKEVRAWLKLNSVKSKTTHQTVDRYGSKDTYTKTTPPRSVV